MQTNPVSAIVLAGGRSSRMGQDKALLTTTDTKQGQQTWLAACVEKIQELGISDIVISRSPDRAVHDVPAGIYIADSNPQTFLGPVAGIASCLPYCQHQAVVVVPVDMLALQMQTLKKLTTQSQSSYFEGFYLPVLFMFTNTQHRLDTAKQLQSQLQQLAEPCTKAFAAQESPTVKKNHLSIRGLLRAVEAQALPYDQDIQRQLINLNTQAEWHQYLSKQSNKKEDNNHE